MTTAALIICIGNDLVADDGIGPAIYQELSGRTLSESIRLRLLGLGGMLLLDEFAGEDLLIVVDAVQFGAAPGTIHILDWTELPQGGAHVSCHGIGVREAVEISRNLYPEKTPARVYLVGIEGKCFDLLGVGLSAEVAANIESAADRIIEIIGEN
ncbi:hydrogenase maturation protease [Desulfopila inferna]|uniref:hydrogenase maturation protease n=1 Tax=Desulfopila inferna TaxID=468528 RepID=UPI001964DB72|nr:hydrogenase maturation protease [Desulfopila inferna]MBM9604820.1 hydrogenase maturation protease [Desulfopila inferna]